MGLGRVEGACINCYLRSRCEKYLANRSDVFWALMDLVADAKSVWSSGKLLKAFQSFYC